MTETFQVNEGDDFTVPRKQARPLNSFARKGDVGLSARMMEEALRGVKSPDVYNEVIGELNYEPKSSRVDGLMDEVLQIRQAEQEALGEAILAEEGIPPSERTRMLQAIGQQTNIVTPMDASAYISAVPDRNDVHPIQERIFQNINDMLEAQDEIEKARLEMAKGLDTTVTGASLDILTSAIPFTAGTSYYRLLKEVMPDRANALDIFLPGEALRTIKDELLRLKNEDPVQFQMFSKELFAGIEAHGGLLGENDFQKYTMMQEVFHEVETGDTSGVDWDRWINNGIGLLDTIGVGGLFGKILKFGKSAISSRADKIARANPRKAAGLLDEGLRSDAAAQALGFSNSADLASNVLVPMPEGVAANNMPGQAHANWLRAESEFQKISKDVDTFIHYTDADKDSVTARAVKTLEEFQGAEYFPSWSNISRLDDGVRIDAVYGQTGEYGFNTADDAKEAAERLFPGQEVAVRKRKLATGKLWKNPVVSFPKKTGIVVDEFDYFLQVRKEYGFNKDTVDVNALVFGPGQIGKGATIPLARHILDPDSLFGRTVAGGGNVSFDKSRGIEDKLFTLLKPLKDAGGQDKQLRILDLVAEGEGVKTYTPGELEALGFTTKMAEGYYAVRSVMDGMYALNNAKLAREMTAKGMQTIKHTDFQVYAKPLTSEDATGITHAFDLVGRKVVNVDDIEKLYAQGFQLGRMHSPIRIGKSGTRNVLFKVDADTTIGGLPANPLKYVPGYVTRYYDNTHFVVLREAMSMDGVSTMSERAIHAVNSRREAERAIRVMKQNGEIPEGATLEWRLDRNLQPETRSQFGFDLEQQRGGVFFGRRGEKITDLEGTAKIKDPMESLSRAIGRMANSLGTDDWVQTMKSRFTHTYSDMLTPDAAGMRHFPQTADELSAVQGTTARHKQAKVVLDYINDMENVQSETSQAWLRVLGSTADWVDDLMGNSRIGSWTSHYLRGVRKDPMQKIRGLTFDAFLALAPLRQIVLQSQQATYLYAIDPGYVSTKMFPQLAMLKMGANKIGTAGWADTRKRMAKVMGVSEKEYEDFIRGWTDSGMDAAIDAHTLSRESFSHLADSLSRNRLTRYASAPGRGIKWVVGAARTVGFDAGERLNLQQTWLIARNQFIKNNPGKDLGSSQARQEIAAQARSMALSMTKSGALKYQRGFLSVTTQFASIMHKATLGMMTNKALTRSQRARIAAGQALLYGGAGIIGLDAAMEYAQEELGLELTAEQSQLVMNGLAEWLVNTSIRAITDDDTNIAIAEDLAPAGGIDRYVGDMAETALTMPAWELALGPSAALGNRIFKAAELAQYIYQRPVSTPEKLGDLVNNLASIGSGYSNVMKAQLMKNLGHVVTTGGDPVMEATLAESGAKLFGFDKHEMEGYYEIQNQIAGMTRKEKMKPAQIDARRYYEQMKKVTAYYRNDMKNSLDDIFYSRLAEAMQAEAAILNHVDEDYRDAVLHSFYQMLGQGVDVREDALWDDITQLAIGNQHGDSLQNLLTQMEYRGLVTSDQDKQSIEALWNWFIDEKVKRNAQD
jgi:hypothetical protein